MKILDVPQTGKLGLTVTYPGRNGLIRRMKVSPRNPHSSAQTVQRSIFKQCAQAYKALTDVQQNAWIAAAARHRTSPTLGQSGPLTGLQLYVKLNAAMQTIGGNSMTTPPAAPAAQATHVSGLTITNTSGTIALNLDTTDSPPDGTMLWACAPQNSGVRRLVSPRFLGTLTSPTNNKINITTLYADKFGAPKVGDRVYVEVCTNSNGWEGVREVFSARVPSAT